MKIAKKVSAAVLALLLLMGSVGGLVPAAFAADSTTYVTTNDVNMRKKADKDSSIVVVLPKDTSVEVTSTSNSYWYKAVYTNSKGKEYKGYISSSYLKKKASSKTGTYTATGDVYMRAKASKSSKAVVVVKEGDTLKVTNTSHGKWYKATYKTNGKTYKGYVSNKYLKKGTTSSKTGNYVTTGDVYMRAKASKSAKSVVVVKKGATIKVTNTSHGKWYKATYQVNGKTYKGYVSNKYLKKK